MTQHDPAILKQKLRRQFLDRRQAISMAGREKAAQAVCDIFLDNIKVLPGQVVSGYWPIRSELDPRPLLLALFKHDVTVALPRTEKGNMPSLTFWRWTPDMSMQNGEFGIQVPDSAFSEHLTPDIVLLPLLAFDRQGNRLGYGQGYYDRTLQDIGLIKPFLGVGIGYACQMCDALPAEVHDKRLDCVVTETALQDFRAKE